MLANLSTRSAIRRRASQGPARRAGFTLVELLVVIVILAILAALLAPVVYQALVTAKEGRIVAEISTLDGAIKAYKERYGSYPPSDFTNLGTAAAPNTTTVVGLHLAKAFPRCNVSTEISAINTVTAGYNGGSPLSPSQALVFWLSGFCTDPTAPISGLLNANGTPNLTAPRTSPLYQFDQTRLVSPPGGAAGAPSVYVPSDGQGTPYVYFNSASYPNYYQFNASGFPTGFAGGTAITDSFGGFLRPYLSSAAGGNPNNVFVNPTTFQIISAGLDGNYGNGQGGPYPNGTDGSGSPVFFYGTGDLDNLANFSTTNFKSAEPTP